MRRLYDDKMYDEHMALSYDDVLLVPQFSNLVSRTEVDLSCKFALPLNTGSINELKLKYPIMSAAMDTVTGDAMAREIGRIGGIGIIHRFQSVEDRMRAINNARIFVDTDEPPNIPVGVAVGLKDSIDDCVDLSHTADILALDVAHADAIEVIRFTEKLRKHIVPTCFLMVGNIATRFAAQRLIDAGANILKVGIGGGAVCKTRTVTGFGVPNVTAIMYAREAVNQRGAGDYVSVVADGGIRGSADIAKAMAAGANCVMLGSLLAGTSEAPGNIEVNENGEAYKMYRGMASNSAQVDFKGKLTEGTVPEGVSTLIPFKGQIKPIVEDLMGGLRSSFTYGDAKNCMEFYQNTTFVRVSKAAVKESVPHILTNRGTIHKHG